MPQWKINLIVLWFGQFLTLAGMTMIMPFLSLYLQSDFGLSGEHEVAAWTGVIFAGNFVTAFLFQPIWGKLADRHGRKVMLLRSGFGMATVTLLMGFATEPWHLLVLRLLNGTISGFNPAAVALVSATTPKEKMGFAMGVIQSGLIAGTVMGPLMGGAFADQFGFRPIFYITGGLLFCASLLALFLVREKFDREKAAAAPQISVLQGFRELRGIRPLMVLLGVTFLIQFSLMNTQSLMPLFVQELHGTANLAFWSGTVGAVTGISNMLASPLLGRLSDRIGAHRVLGFSLAGAGLLFIPQAFVGAVWQLLAVRFALGIFLGGLVPSVNALIRRHTPEGMESRAYSFNSSMLSLGNMAGPVFGGLTSSLLGIEGLFLLSAVLLLTGSAFVAQTSFTKATARPS
jgi:Arabinose efflux permease